ncbi:hypothetical protein ABIB54_001317 [Frigoribacterium sp. UYMn621]
MSAVGRWVKSRKTLASALVIAVVAGVPLTIAALHPGFPVTDVKLTSRDVWVTNGKQLLGGRLNRQIDELNGSVVASSANFDVLQDGDSLYMHNPDAGRIESVDPASTQVTSAIDVPKNSEVGYGGTTLVIVSPKGELWAVPSVGDLQFNYVSTPPLVKLGVGGHATITKTGAIIAVSPTKKKIYRMDTLASPPVASAFPSVGAFQISAVGEQAVIFDQATNELITQDGTKHSLPKTGLRLQQVGAKSDYAVLATADSLLEVDLGSGSVKTIPADVSTPAKNAAGVSAPVFLSGCAHGAWATSQKYLLACDGQKPVRHDIEEPTRGSELEFRVNRTVIALNDLSNGNVWLVNENMRLVDNWDDVTPPAEKQSEETGDQKSATQSFEDTLAQRTDVNRPPTAVDDSFGIRPGRTTILPLLDNDTDPDGDVLVISAFDGIADSTGHLDPIDGGRALQFTPAAGFVGSVSFGYTVDDGRGGTATARVTAHVVPESSNQEPVEIRKGGVSVEADQTVSYNVLTNWRDPDGDDLYLVNASPKSGDLVRFTPDGFITFTHQTSEIGKKDVVFLVSDGHGAQVQGTLTVDVKPAGSLDPVGTPDFATVFTNETVVVKPLENDISPSGAQLQLVAMETPSGKAVASFNSDSQEITFSSSEAGVHYLKYTLQAGAKTSVGLVRVDVRDKPQDDSLPPVAVKDTAYLRGDEPTTVAVLANDVSPNGRVLAVQSIAVPPELIAKGLVVELLESAQIRVTSPAALTEQVSFTYTISDGFHEATAGVTVVPVPALTKHQPPIAANDSAKVRVGDVATLDVLANDVHPDRSPMTLDTTLVTPPTAGLAFVSKNKLRFQAPMTPGAYTVDYRVLDPFGETATATASFTVIGLDAKANQDPTPRPLTARVLAGDSIKVQIPLDGIDPDGDSAQLLSFPVGPSLGSIESQGTDFFIYKSSAAASGTDTFSYKVFDAFGATGDADIKIAVIPPPKSLSNPIAAPDSVSVRPGRVAQVDLVANDSDPQSAPIQVSKKLIDVPQGIKASVVKGQYLVLTAPDTEQSFSMRYELTNNRGGKSVSYVLVKVTKDAPILPPTAEDISILPKTIAGKQSTTVDVFDGHAFNPSGPTEDLVVSVEGPNAGSAKLLEKNGRIEVTPGKTRQAIAYRVTNEKDKLTAMAFILVPAAVSKDFDQQPSIDPSLPVQYVGMNETRTWKLKDILTVPSGREAHIIDKATVSALQSNGASPYVDADTITFTPAKDYRGPAAVKFSVSDGASKDDPKGLKANLTLNIVVGDPQFRDTPPEFTSPNEQVEVGETKTIDLRASTGHPNPQILQEVTYSDITGTSAGLQASLNGSQLTLTTPRNAKKGSSYKLGVTLKWDKFTVPGTITVTVVGSSRPLAVAVSDAYETQRGDGAVVAHPLTNDSNPYQTTGEKLTIVDAKVQNSGQPASISFTKDSVTVTPSAALKDGRIEIVYTVQDATEDKDREVNGTISVIVSDVPDQVAKPTRTSAIGGDGNATWRFIAPASNGKPITSYDVRTTPGGATANCTAGADCTVSGLSNGTAYTFSARAVNVHGAGPWSVESDQITPYGTPGTASPTLSTANKWATATITASWPAVGATGGTTTYFWSTNSGKSGSTTGTTATFSEGAGSYTVSVYAKNQGGKQGGTGTSGALSVQNQPIPTAPQNVSTPADRTGAGTLTWTWNAPANATPDAAGDGIKYIWSASNGDSGTTTGRSASINVGDTTANYSLTVKATNSGGTGPSAGSGSTHVTKASNPRVAVAWGGNAQGQPNCSDASCHFIKINVYDLGPNTSYTATSPGCSSRTVNTDGNGNGSVEFSCYFGYPDQNVTVSAGGHSDTRLWKNHE